MTILYQIEVIYFKLKHVGHQPPISAFTPIRWSTNRFVYIVYWLNGSKLSCFSICSSTTTRRMKMTGVVSNVGQCVSINVFLFKIACGNLCARVCKINVCMVNTQSRVAFFVIKVLKINQNATNSHELLLQTFNFL